MSELKVILDNEQKKALWQRTLPKIDMFLKLQEEISTNLDLIRGNTQQIEAHKANVKEWGQVMLMINQFLNIKKD